MTSRDGNLTMIDVALCLAEDHNPWMVLVALLICGGGAFAVAQIFERVRETAGWARVAWIFLTAVASGATIWCTHFVAMIAYDPRVPVRIDPVLTMTSLLLAIGGSSVGLFVATRNGSARPLRLLGGALLGGAIAAMHFTGMAAYRVDGIVQWREPYVVAAILCAVTFSAAAFDLLGSRVEDRRRVRGGTALLIAAIGTLHFIAMAAMRITPLALTQDPLAPAGLQALGIATALVGCLVIAAGATAMMIDRQTRSDTLRSLRHMALNDSLTGLPNRAGFEAAFARFITRAQAEGSMFAIVMIDLDRFKEINDLHGHQAGDSVLVETAARMQAVLTEEDVIARLGGDEFVVLTRFDNPGRIGLLTERLSDEARRPIRLGAIKVRVSASIGAALFPRDAADAETLVNNADLAMYRAKKEKALAPRFYDAALDETIRDRRELASELRTAIENDQLELHYQVQTSVDTRTITGYEALVRWNHPRHGQLPPDRFISVAEENGLILPLGEWVLRRACRDAALWMDDAKVAVNVSPLQLVHADLPGLFHQVLLETGLPPRRLEVELTESALMSDRDNALHILRRIKALGVGIALDDFGTGYSSLETLRIFPFDKIKLDRFFISGLEESPQSTAIIRAVLALGKSLSIPVLAEGIETERQLAILRREGCDEAQGFLLGYPEPLPAARIRERNENVAAG